MSNLFGLYETVFIGNAGDHTNSNSKVYIAGHRGMVGSAIKRQLEARGYSNLITRTHSELDLTDQRTVTEFFKTEKPEYVFLAAAKVGGSLQTAPILPNLSMRTS